MTTAKLPLNANPLALVRELPTKTIPLDQVIPREDIVTDQIFLNKYLGYEEGKVTVYATRLSIDRIKPGFWRANNKRFEYICDDVPDKDIRLLKEQIQQGNRPALYIYPNPNNSDPFDFVCPDDVPTHRAYTSLGIRTPPVILMGK